MYTKDLTIFTKMVNIAKDQNLEYRIFYSYHKRNSTNEFTEAYKLMLCTNLFTVTFEENFILENTCAIKDFIKYNADSCIELDFDLNFNKDNSTKLNSFR